MKNTNNRRTIDWLLTGNFFLILLVFFPLMPVATLESVNESISQLSGLSLLLGQEISYSIPEEFVEESAYNNTNLTAIPAQIPMILVFMTALFGLLMSLPPVRWLKFASAFIAFPALPLLFVQEMQLETTVFVASQGLITVQVQPAFWMMMVLFTFSILIALFLGYTMDASETRTEEEASENSKSPSV